jgi:hypothetical protein
MKNMVQKDKSKEASGPGLSSLMTEDARMQRLMNDDDVNKTNNADAKNSFTLAPNCSLHLTTSDGSTRLDQNSFV